MMALSDFYETEIRVIEVAEKTLHKVGQGKGFMKVIYLIFYGRHYDLGAKGEQRLFTKYKDDIEDVD